MNTTEPPERELTPEDLVPILQREGQQLTIPDLANVFESVAPALEFGSLDRATRMVFDYLVREQTDILRDHLSAIDDLTPVMLEVGQHVYDGFIIGRRLLNTHTTHISYSSQKEDAQARGQEVLAQFESIKPVDLLKVAGGGALEFLQNWGVVNYKGGIYSQLEDEDDAATLPYLAALNGFALAIGEHIIAAHWQASR